MTRSSTADTVWTSPTRSAFIDDHCDQDILILGAHFNTPTGVYIEEQQGRKRIRFES